MGFFSFKTADTNKSIPSRYSNRKPFTVYMVTREGQVFEEKDYEGYGDFGGKDIYVLCGELNDLTGPNDEATRSNFFDVIAEKGIRKGTKVYIHSFTAKGGKYFNHYDEPIVAEGGKTANQLVASGEFKSFGGNMRFDYFDSLGWKVPKIVERLPKVFKPGSDAWKNWFDRLPCNENCEFQGFFYE